MIHRSVHCCCSPRTIAPPAPPPGVVRWARRRRFLSSILCFFSHNNPGQTGVRIGSRRQELQLMHCVVRNVPVSTSTLLRKYVFPSLPPFSLTHVCNIMLSVMVLSAGLSILPLYLWWQHCSRQFKPWKKTSCYKRKNPKYCSDVSSQKVMWMQHVIHPPLRFSATCHQLSLFFNKATTNLYDTQSYVQQQGPTVSPGTC